MTKTQGHAALAMAISVLLLGCGAHEPPLRARTAAAPEVRRLDVGTGTNAYVVMGARPILVDTGWGKSTEKLERALARIAVAPRDLALIVLTHGHGDHAGGARRMRELSGAKVVAGKGDVEMLEAGHNRPLRPMGTLGKLLRSTSDKPFPAFTPDIALAPSEELDLRAYGIEGKVVPVPGHTPGSLAVVLATGEAIVGDLVRGGLVRRGSPARHFFHDDCRAAEAHIARLVQAGSRRLFVGHGGPLDGGEAAAEQRGQDCK